MTATRNVLADPVEGLSYQLDTSPDGLGGIRWDLFRYQRAEPDDAPSWHQVYTRVTAAPPDGHYRESALSWLRELGHDPAAMDLALILPDSVERLRPDA